MAATKLRGSQSAGRKIAEVIMNSPYMSTQEVADLFRRSRTTIHNWNSRNKKTGEKAKKGFPDPVIHGFFLRSEIEEFGRLSKHD